MNVLVQIFNGGSNRLVFGEDEHDDHRVIVDMPIGSMMQATANVVYPCRACGWAGTCSNGEWHS